MRFLNHAETHGGPRSDGSSTDATKLAVKIVCILFWLSFAIFNMYLMWLASRLRRRHEEEAKNQTMARVIAKKLAGMTTEAKIAYYDMLFSKQGNQIKVTEDQIFIVSESLSTSSTTSAIEKQGKQTKIPTVAENDIENGRAAVSGSEEPDMLDVETLVQLYPTVVHECEQPTTCRRSKDSGEKSNNDDSGEKRRPTMQNKIDGQCAICLEIYNIGDIIAYNMYTCIKGRESKIQLDSENVDSSTTRATKEGCYHVFHKDCLVQYLSNRQISEKSLNDGQADNPVCPICRKPYVALLPIDADRKLESTIDQEECSITCVDDGSSLSI